MCHVTLGGFRGGRGRWWKPAAVHTRLTPLCTPAVDIRAGRVLVVIRSYPGVYLPAVESRAGGRWWNSAAVLYVCVHTARGGVPRGQNAGGNRGVCGVHMIPAVGFRAGRTLVVTAVILRSA